MEKDIIRIENGKLIVPNKPLMPLLKAMESALTFGQRQLEYLTRLLKRHITAKEKFSGLKFSLVKKLSRKLVHGCQLKHLKRSKNIWSV
jgi:hypothetical protein